MSILFYILLGTLLLGQLGGISLRPGVVVYPHEVVLFLVYVVGAIRLIRAKKKIAPKLLVPIAGFVAAGLVSLALNSTRFSVDQLGVSSLYLVRWVFYAGIYVVVATSMFHADTIKRGLYWYGVLFGILGILQYVLYPDLRNLIYLGWDPHHYRLVSSLLDPNFAGIILVLTLLLGIHLWLTVKKNGIYAVTGIVLVIAVYLTYSRSAYLAFVAGVVSWIVMKKQWKLFVVLLGLLALLLVLPIPGGDTHQLFRVDSSLARLDNWKETITLIADRPILGHGFNTLRYVWAHPLVSDGVVSRASSGVDSSILFVLATTGILGLIPYVWIYWKAMSRQMRFLLPLVVALFVDSAFINSAFYPWVMIWVWCLFGAAEMISTSRT